MEKKAPKLDFLDMLLLVPFALLFDLLSIIPLIGNLISLGGVLIFRLIFFLKDMETKGMFGSTIGALFVEGIPIFSALPAVTAYLFFIYFKEKAEETLAPEGIEQEAA
ncbi:MAG: hypothetical protein Q8P45_02105 [Candidatus Harrisonbacteria bacterium]|nr:hypothetical protein [Candidatus Harrisonbacteria bacterium]